MNPEIGMRVRNVQPDGKPGRSYREVAEVGDGWVSLRFKGDKPYRISREDFDRYWAPCAQFADNMGRMESE